MYRESRGHALKRTFEGIQALGDAIEQTGITVEQRKLILDLVRQSYRLATLIAESKRLENIRLFEGWDDDEKVRP